jgi:hypothetical protein
MADNAPCCTLQVCPVPPPCGEVPSPSVAPRRP